MCNSSIYLRLSLTPECNLRCRYCRPQSGLREKHPAKLLGDTELIGLVRAIDEAKPIRKLRFTGGEPLLRPGVPGLVESFKDLLPDAELCLTTNGILLGDAAHSLKRAGLNKLNISLDTMDANRFRELAGSAGLTRVLAGIAAARSAGFRQMKINTVLMRSFNAGRLADLVRYAAASECEIRFVELMPFGEGAPLFDSQFYSAGEALEEIRESFEYVRTEAASDTAERHALFVDGKEITIGFITPISHEFCSGCDRIRLDSFGRIFPCLRAEIGNALQGLAPEPLKERILCTLENKKAPAASWPARPMVQLGG